MNVRIAALCGAMALALCGCPVDPDGGQDGGTDAGIDTPQGTCTGGCGGNQVCDTETNTCVDGCAGGCTLGQLCVKQGDTFACITPQTSCGGSACEAGQNTCVSGSCSCLPFALAAADSCAADGKVCHGAYNPVTQTGGACEDPGPLEHCVPDCQGPDCGTCTQGFTCDSQLFVDFGTCWRICDALRPCTPDELCAGSGGSSGVCFPKSVFGSGQEGPEFSFACKDHVPLPDGGTTILRTFASRLCLLTNDMDGTAIESTPTGTCTWAKVKSDTRMIPITYCRSPGDVPENGACKTQESSLDRSVVCGTGLECAPTDDQGNGICLPICNAKLRPDGTVAEPSCDTGSSCVNIYRFEDDNSSVGVCMKDCNVFSTDTDFGCTAYGSHASSCVPTSPQGVQLVTGAGQGICVPQRPTAAAEGEACSSVDPMVGAACQTGLICTQLTGEAQPRCVKPCDVACAGENPPARCQTEANAGCGTGQTCTSVTGTTGAILGYCL